MAKMLRSMKCGILGGPGMGKGQCLVALNMRVVRGMQGSKQLTLDTWLGRSMVIPGDAKKCGLYPGFLSHQVSNPTVSLEVLLSVPSFLF
jgi:hypothetical protein